ncbi:hypothetical protein BDV19DRAFT_231506 [Aspergillus venezuelensis]
MLSYTATVELSVSIRPESQRLGIGSALLDAVLSAARGVKHSAFEDEDLKGLDGDGVPLRNVLAVMAVDSEGRDGGEALRRWYIHPTWVCGEMQDGEGRV